MHLFFLSVMQKQHFLTASHKYVQLFSLVDSTRHTFSHFSSSPCITFPPLPLLYRNREQLPIFGPKNCHYFPPASSISIIHSPHLFPSSIPPINLPNSCSLDQAAADDTTGKNRDSFHTSHAPPPLLHTLYFPSVHPLSIHSSNPLLLLLSFQADAFQGKGRKGGIRGRSICLKLLYLLSVLSPSPFTITFLVSP